MNYKNCTIPFSVKIFVKIFHSPMFTPPQSVELPHAWHSMTQRKNITQMPTPFWSVGTKTVYVCPGSVNCWNSTIRHYSRDHTVLIHCSESSFTVRLPLLKCYLPIQIKLNHLNTKVDHYWWFGPYKTLFCGRSCIGESTANQLSNIGHPVTTEIKELTQKIFPRWRHLKDNWRR